MLFEVHALSAAALVGIAKHGAVKALAVQFETLRSATLARTRGGWDVDEERGIVIASWECDFRSLRRGLLDCFLDRLEFVWDLGLHADGSLAFSA